MNAYKSELDIPFGATNHTQQTHTNSTLKNLPNNRTQIADLVSNITTARNEYRTATEGALWRHVETLCDPGVYFFWLCALSVLVYFMYIAMLVKCYIKKKELRISIRDGADYENLSEESAQESVQHQSANDLPEKLEPVCIDMNGGGKIVRKQPTRIHTAENFVRDETVENGDGRQKDEQNV